MAVRCLIDVRLGVAWVKAMVTWVLINFLAVGLSLGYPKVILHTIANQF